MSKEQFPQFSDEYDAKEKAHLERVGKEKDLEEDPRKARAEKAKLTLVKYKHVQFAGLNESIWDVKHRLGSEGWGLRGETNLEIEADIEETLEDELTKPGWRIVIVGNKAFTFRRFGNQPGTERTVA
jgi:hypothetical protein